MLFVEDVAVVDVCVVLSSRANRPAVGVRYDPYPVTVATVTVPRRTEPGTYDTYAGAVAAGTSHASITSYATAQPASVVAAAADPYQLQPIAAAAFPRVQPAAANTADSFARELLELYSNNPAAFATFATRSPALVRQSAMAGLGNSVPMALGLTELPTSSYTLAPARTDYFEKRLGPGYVLLPSRTHIRSLTVYTSNPYLNPFMHDFILCDVYMYSASLLWQRVCLDGDMSCHKCRYCI